MCFAACCGGPKSLLFVGHSAQTGSWLVPLFCMKCMRLLSLCTLIDGLRVYYEAVGSVKTEHFLFWYVCGHLGVRWISVCFGGWPRFSSVCLRHDLTFCMWQLVYGNSYILLACHFVFPPVPFGSHEYKIRSGLFCSWFTQKLTHTYTYKRHSLRLRRLIPLFHTCISWVNFGSLWWGFFFSSIWMEAGNHYLISRPISQIWISDSVTCTNVPTEATMEAQ